ncbi:MAG TPA: RNA methyltransferase [Myxococcota bacterium]
MTTTTSPTTSARLSVALVHHPVLDRFGGVQTTALTNLDVHDIARSSRTYGCAAYYIVTPIQAQIEQAQAITGFWEGERGQKKNKDRTEAMSRVHVVVDVADAIAAETAVLGRKPLIVVTSARPQGTVPYTHLRERLDAGENALLLFGTGHGLADSVHTLADLVLAPLVGPADDDGSRWNHLSVRSAAAIILDRLRGS